MKILINLIALAITIQVTHFERFLDDEGNPKAALVRVNVSGDIDGKKVDKTTEFWIQPADVGKLVTQTNYLKDLVKRQAAMVLKSIEAPAPAQRPTTSVKATRQELEAISVSQAEAEAEKQKLP